MFLAALAPLVWAVAGLVAVAVLGHDTEPRRAETPRIAARPAPGDLRPAA